MIKRIRSNDILFAFKNEKTCTVFLSSYRNTSESLGDREMLTEHEPQTSVPTAFSSSRKLSRVFLQLDRNTEYMYANLNGRWSAVL